MLQGETEGLGLKVNCTTACKTWLSGSDGKLMFAGGRRPRGIIRHPG